MASSSPATPDRWQSKPKTRTAGQRRVYGKRKADAPRVVFDHNIPMRVKERAKQDTRKNTVDDVQARLAEIKIEDEPSGEIVQEDLNGRDAPQKPASVGLSICRDESQKEDSTELSSANDTARKSQTEPEQESAPSDPEHSSNATIQPKRRRSRVEVVIYSKPKTPAHREHTGDIPTTDSTRQTVRKKTPRPRRSSGCVKDGKVAAYVRPILNEALSPVAAHGVQRFNAWAARAENMFEVVKLAEGSYGEVYKLRFREEACKGEMSKSKLARLREYGDGVFKVVPLNAQKGPGSKKFTSVAEIVSEVKMLKYLDPIPGFARFREIHVVQGRFPSSFQAAWNHYKETKDDCLNPDPSNKRAYPETQLWAIVEMDDAGCELEKFAWSSIFQIYDIFWGVAMALARAEEYALFEHRDLHLGNVCIRSARPDGYLDPPTDLEVARQSSSSGLGLSTLQTTIIDYSLSRAEMQINPDPNAPLEVVSTDLDRKQIFDSIGRDEDEKLLRDTYRHMRAELYTGNPSAAEKAPDIDGIWAEYAPGTNLVWLVFLLKNLLRNRTREPSTPQRKALAPCSPNRSTTNSKKGNKAKSSEKPLAKQVHANEPQKHVVQLKKTLEERLNSILKLLDIEHGHEDMCCAADLVAYAIDSRWLEEKDFF